MVSASPVCSKERGPFQGVPAFIMKNRIRKGETERGEREEGGESLQALAGVEEQGFGERAEVQGLQGP